MALATVGLQTHIWNNNLRSILLLATYPLLIMAVVWLCAAVIGAMFGTTAGHPETVLPMAQAFGNNIIIAYWPLILTAVFIWFIVAYFFHTRMVRMLSHAHPVSRSEEPELYNLLENLCISRGLSMPRLEVIETDAMNAYASGIDNKSYAVTVTRGLMQRLDRDELEAVLAHELTHIMNRDVRLLIVSIIFAGMIGFIAQLVWSSIRYSFFVGGRNRDGRVVLVMMVIGLILWLGYMATIFTRFALSRRREYMADAGAIELTKKPEAMMRALQRISGNDRIPAAPDDISLMCTTNSKKFMGLFATHPPIDARIQAISEVTGTPVPQAGMPPPPSDDGFRSPWSR